MLHKLWRHALVLAVLAGLTGLGVLLADRLAPAPTATPSTVVVERGALTETLVEIGELAPREPLLVQVPLAGRVEWLIEEGAWVEAGDRIAVLGDEQALTEIAELRGKLLTAEQELALARLRYEQLVIEQDQAVVAAEEALAVETFAHAVLTGEAEGGDALIDIHKQLQPLEETIAARRAAYAEADAAYRAADRRYRDATDAWQSAEDQVLQLQARLDELRITAEGEVAPGDQAARQRQAEAAAESAEVEEELAAGRAALPELRQAREAAAAAREAETPARQAAAEALATAEAAAEDLYIRLEIEKRALPLVELRLDAADAELDLAAAEEAAADGAIAFDNGSISALRLDELRGAVAAAENRLAIIRERIAMAERPPAEAERLEVASRLAEARVAAEQAAEKRRRKLAEEELAIDQQLAELAELRHQLDQKALDFPDILASELATLNEQLAELPPGAEARAALQAERDRLQAQLAEAEANPPNVVRAPQAGIVAIGETDHRPIQVGDELRLRQVVASLKTRGDMAVECQVNEVDVDHLAVGMPCRIELPALPGQEWGGRVEWIAGAGHDKFQPYARWGADAEAGVVVFPVRIALTETAPAFRQGMTALVTIVVGQWDDALHLPRAAVRWDETDADSARVQTAAGPRRIQARPAGAERVIVLDGLQAGDEVLLPSLEARP